jgi:hypothetical protein
MTTKPSHRLTLKDRLSRLTFLQACRLLGDEGRQLIQRGGKWEICLDEQVYLQGDLLPREVQRRDCHSNFDGRGQRPVALELHVVPMAV